MAKSRKNVFTSKIKRSHLFKIVKFHSIKILKVHLVRVLCLKNTLCTCQRNIFTLPSLEFCRKIELWIKIHEFWERHGQGKNCLFYETTKKTWQILTWHLVLSLEWNIVLQPFLRGVLRDFFKKSHENTFCIFFQFVDKL